ncbi:MAG: hypothetical protein ACFFD4_38635 [Candidatus Odinarchaeota archaeon]
MEKTGKYSIGTDENPRERLKKWQYIIEMLMDIPLGLIVDGVPVIRIKDGFNLLVTRN